MPSVRGRQRVVVAGLLTATSALTGALVGFAGAIGWSVLLGPPLNGWALATLVGLVLLLDAVRVVAPLSVQRQVPQLWGRIFSAPVVAVLYGARLGVGPLTILRTWLWWGAFLAGASAGLRWAAVVGALFGAARVVAMLAVGVRAGGLRRRERTVSLVVAVAVVVAVAALAVGVDGHDRTRSSASALDVPAGRVVDPTATTASSSTTVTTAAAAAVDTPLASALPETLLPGWKRADDDPSRRLGPLDLDAAAKAEKDEMAERSVLETRHFQRGQARGWRGPDGQVGYASVYEFASPEDASAYLVDGVTTISARGARLYDVASPTGAQGFSQAGESTVSHGVVFSRGARFVLVFVTGKDSGVDPGDAAAAARAVEASVGG